MVNVDVTAAASEYGLYYAPDPSSQTACTIGGNIAENSGGPHCLAYGVTTNHVLGMEVVLADGSVHWLGGRTREAPGYDLRGIVIGSEGTLAVATKIIVRLLKQPEAIRTLLGGLQGDRPGERRGVRHHRRRSRPRGDRDDGPPVHPGSRARRQRGLSGGSGSGAPRRGGRAAGDRGGGVGGGREHLPQPQSDGDKNGGRRGRAGPALGRSERASWARWAGSRQTTIWSTAPFPGRSCPRFSRASRRSRTSTGCPSPTCCTRETATCTRRSCSTSGTPTSSPGRWRPAATS